MPVSDRQCDDRMKTVTMQGTAACAGESTAACAGQGPAACAWRKSQPRPWNIVMQCLRRSCVTLTVWIILTSHLTYVAGQGNVLTVPYTIDEEETVFIGNLVSDVSLADHFPAQDLVNLRFNFLPQSDSFRKYFVIHSSDGQLWTNGSVDRETLCPFTDECKVDVDVIVLNQRTDESRIIRIYITVNDVNDNEPFFPVETYPLSISEMSSPNAIYVLPSATDADRGVLSVQRYALDANYSEFELEASDLQDIKLVLKKKLDREKEQAYTIELIAYDGGEPPRSGTMQINVKVQDSNDNSPTFNKESYSTVLPEDTLVEASILHVTASDPDEGRNGLVKYRFSTQTANTHGSTFSVDPDTGVLSLSEALDYEKVTEYQLTVIAQDQGPDSQPTYVKIHIVVEDVNDHKPTIEVSGANAGRAVEIQENRGEGVLVAHINVHDLDKGPSGVVTCEMHSQYFTLVEEFSNTFYKIVSRQGFDREERDFYTAIVECVDGGDPIQQRANEVINVTITDENDHEPEFVGKVHTATIAENNTMRFPIMAVSATDRDIGRNGLLQYRMHQDASNLLKINQTSGVIYTNAVFDYEKLQRFVFHVLVVDSGEISLTATAEVQLTITDINDEAPVFDRYAYSFVTLEDQPPHAEVGSVNASDADSPPFKDFTFKLDRKSDPHGTFHIDPHSGRITTNTRLDREHQHRYDLVVMATDKAAPYLSSTVNVSVIVGDVNDNAPMILHPGSHESPFQLSVRTPRGYVFTQVVASDADTADNARLLYIIAKGDNEGVFSIHPISGNLSVYRNLGSVTSREYDILVMVKDQGSPQKSAVVTLKIIVNDTIPFTGVAPDSSQGGHHTGGAEDEGSSGFRLGFHQRIIVILACVTAVLVVILVTAIIWVRYRQTKRVKEAYKYMCRVDMAQKMAGSNGNGGGGVGAGGSLRGVPRDVEGQADSHGQDSDVSRDSCDLKDGDPNSAHLNATLPFLSSKTHLTLEDLQRARWSRQPSLQSVHGGSQRSTTPVPPQHLSPQKSLHPQSAATQHPPGSHSHKMEVQQLLGMLRKEADSDTASGTSGEVSNTDSGRGPSEEGDRLQQMLLLQLQQQAQDSKRLTDGPLAHGDRSLVPPPRPPRMTSLPNPHVITHPVVQVPIATSSPQRSLLPPGSQPSWPGHHPHERPHVPGSTFLPDPHRQYMNPPHYGRGTPPPHTGRGTPPHSGRGTPPHSGRGTPIQDPNIHKLQHRDRPLSPGRIHGSRDNEDPCLPALQNNYIYPQRGLLTSNKHPGKVPPQPPLRTFSAQQPRGSPVSPAESLNTSLPDGEQDDDAASTNSSSTSGSFMVELDNPSQEARSVDV